MRQLPALVEPGSSKTQSRSSGRKVAIDLLRHFEKVPSLISQRGEVNIEVERESDLIGLVKQTSANSHG